MDPLCRRCLCCVRSLCVVGVCVLCALSKIIQKMNGLNARKATSKFWCAFPYQNFEMVMVNLKKSTLVQYYCKKSTVHIRIIA